MQYIVNGLILPTAICRRTLMMLEEVRNLLLAKAMTTPMRISRDQDPILSRIRANKF